jgi:hypothetical protein
MELLNGPMNRPWGVRTASFTDPNGLIWEIAADLPRPGLSRAAAPGGYKHGRLSAGL